MTNAREIWHTGGVETSRRYPNLSRLSREQRLALYGLAVGAALAAGASSTQAALITLDLTGQPAGSRTTQLNQSLYFDVNAASAAAAFSTSNFVGADFRIANIYNSFSSFAAPISGVNNPSNGIARFFNSGIFFADNFAVSHLVGPPDAFGQGAYVAYYGHGAFGTGGSGYLGLKFIIGSDIHFGWANITVGANDVVTLNSLGYESDPLVPAHVEAPSSAVPDEGSTLAFFVLGAAGVAAFRGRKQKTVSVES